MSAHIRMTYALAMAVSCDTANRSMRAAGRAQWNDDDWNAGVAAFDRCYSIDDMIEERRLTTEMGGGRLSCVVIHGEAGV